MTLGRNSIQRRHKITAGAIISPRLDKYPRWLACKKKTVRKNIRKSVTEPKMNLIPIFIHDSLSLYIHSAHAQTVPYINTQRNTLGFHRKLENRRQPIRSVHKKTLNFVNQSKYRLRTPIINPRALGWDKGS